MKEMTTTEKKFSAIVKELKEEGYTDRQIFAMTVKALDDTKLTDEGKTEALSEINISEKEMTEKITELMHEIGIPAKIIGYYYLRDAIIQAIKNPSALQGITKELYPTIAKTYGATSSRVERAIRHAIEVAWKKGDVNVLREYFSNTVSDYRRQPTNSEFIALISDKFRLKYNLS